MAFVETLAGWTPEFIRSGGAVMVLLLVFSVFALAVCLERAWALRRAVVLPGQILKRIERVRTHQDALALAQQSDALGRSPLAKVIRAVLDNIESPRGRNEEAMVLASESVDSGKASAVLTRLIEHGR